MMEKLSANEFDYNLDNVVQKFEAALKKAGKTKEQVILLAATKTVDIETINYAISKGVDYVAENRVQELVVKHDGLLPVHEHFIGHLQTNKVKDVINRVELIQSVDSYKLANEISKQALNNNKVMDILLEINIGQEDSKWGFSFEEAETAVKTIAQLKGVRIRGLMTIPPICESEAEIRAYFSKMYKLFIDIKTKKIDNSYMDILSMGMSDDFDIAIEEGANLVRVGTALFGKRNYL